MIITIGKHKGKSTDITFLKFPDYCVWALYQDNPSGGLIPVVRDVRRRLIPKFNAKPFHKTCRGDAGKGCGKIATRAVVYQNNLDPTWWCDDCNEYSYGALPGKLQEIRTFKDIVNHVETYCGGKRGDYREFVLNIARAKGLPKRVGQAQAQAFFV